MGLQQHTHTHTLSLTHTHTDTHTTLTHTHCDTHIHKSIPFYMVHITSPTTLESCGHKHMKHKHSQQARIIKHTSLADHRNFPKSIHESIFRLIKMVVINV